MTKFIKSGRTDIFSEKMSLLSHVDALRSTFREPRAPKHSPTEQPSGTITAIKPSDRADIAIFQDHLANPAAVIERLLPFDVVCVMRERTPLPRNVIERLPNLKLIASTGSGNASIDLAAAGDRGITLVHGVPVGPNDRIYLGAYLGLRGYIS